MSLRRSLRTMRTRSMTRLTLSMGARVSANVLMSSLKETEDGRESSSESDSSSEEERSLSDFVVDDDHDDVSSERLFCGTKFEIKR